MTHQATTDQVNPQNHPGKDVYAVIGNPIAHSKSPIIHAFFAKQTNQAIHYGRIFSELNSFKETANQFFADGGKGLNITVPFKLEAYELAQKKTARAELAKAANVLWFKDGQLWCDNTDGVGLTRDLQRLLKRQQSSLKNAKVLILGAGGAAQGVIDPLIAEKVSNFMVDTGFIPTSSCQSITSADLNVLEEVSCGITFFTEIEIASLGILLLLMARSTSTGSLISVDAYEHGIIHRKLAMAIDILFFSMANNIAKIIQLMNVFCVINFLRILLDLQSAIHISLKSGLLGCGQFFSNWLATFIKFWSLVKFAPPSTL